MNDTDACEDGHDPTHHMEHRPAYGKWCYDCEKYVKTYMD